MLDGLIVKGIGGFYYVKSEEVIYECKPRGIFRKEQIQPAVGDKVKISVIDESGKIGVIEEICIRKNFLVRPPIANVDQAVLVFAASHPKPDLLLLDKLIIKVLSINIKPLICINKVDLDEDNKYFNQFEPYIKAGFKLIFMSAAQDMGITELREYMEPGIAILAGPSGVGKSTIVRKLQPHENIEIGGLSERIERGKHTTRHVELYEVVKDRFLADTPGFSSFNIDEIESAQLETYYPEFAQYIGKCKFTGCSHVSEPSCGVKNALLDGMIDSQRYERYKEIYSYLKQKERNKY